jgi:hypothetical protein
MERQVYSFEPVFRMWTKSVVENLLESFVVF